MSEPDDDITSLHGLGSLELPALNMKVALLSQRMKRLEEDVDEHEECRKAELKELRERIERDYTLKSDVRLPIKLVYGTAAAVLFAFMAALISLVMKGHAG